MSDDTPLTHIGKDSRLQRCAGCDAWINDAREGKWCDSCWREILRGARGKP